MEEIDLALKRHKQRMHASPKNTQKVSNYFSKILLSIILVLVCVIYINLDEQNLQTLKKYVFESNLTFTKINNWYTNTFGNILPSVKEPVTVSSEALQVTSYLDGASVKSSKSYPVTTLASGVLVYMGEKEDYGNTLIIQGVDGIDIWYGNITDTDLKLYDYVEAGTIVGNTVSEEYYLVFVQDGDYLSYEEYLSS